MGRILKAVQSLFLLTGVARRSSGPDGPRRLHTQYRRHLDLLDDLESLGLPKDARILDVGCGAGHLAETLHNAGYRRIDGVDWLPEGKVTKRSSLDTYVQRDLNQEGDLGAGLAPPYAAVICSDVLEHMEDPARLLRRMAGLLADDGVLLATVPNAFNVMERALLALTGNSSRYRVEEPGEFGHITLYTPNIVKSLLRRAGLALAATRGGAAFFGGLCFFPESRFGPLFSYYVILQIRKRPPGAPVRTGPGVADRDPLA